MLDDLTLSDVADWLLGPLWGVEQLGANGVMLQLVVKTTPSQQWRVSRELRERIKVAFEDERIEIPFPQQTVWHRQAELSQR